MEDLRNAALASIFVASLLGSPHCSAMCGGFTLIYSQSSKKHFRPHFLYNLGRFTTYALLGIIAALLGKTIDAVAPVENFAAIISGVLLIATGTAQLTGIAARSSEFLRNRTPTFLAKAAKRVFTLNDNVKPFLIGVVTTFLPCGWLYAFVALALASASPLKALGIMFVFWLGTLPVMLSVGLLSQKIGTFAGRTVPRLAAVLIIVAGLFSIYSHFDHAGHAHGSSSHHHAHH